MDALDCVQSSYLSRANTPSSVTRMVKCLECGTELPAAAKFCFSCRTQIGLKKEIFQVSSEKLLEKFKELTRDATVKRVIIKDDQGKVVLSIPLTWGAAGAVDLNLSALACRLGRHRRNRYKVHNRGTKSSWLERNLDHSLVPRLRLQLRRLDKPKVLAWRLIFVKSDLSTRGRYLVAL